MLGTRLHVVRAGEGRPIVLLHGNPTWSYLWRHAIPVLGRLGRVHAPDLPGMGLSDTPPGFGHTFREHAAYVDAFLHRLGGAPLVLVGHDWGAVLATDWAARHPQRVAALVLTEGNLEPYADWAALAPGAGEQFSRIRGPGGWAAVRDDADIAGWVQGGTLRRLSAADLAAYDRPFARPERRRAVWRWVNEVPIGGEPRDVAAVMTRYGAWLEQSPTPKLLVTVGPGAVVRAPQLRWVRRWAEVDVVHLGEGGHFVPEDHPDGFPAAVADWLATRPSWDAEADAADGE